MIVFDQDISACDPFRVRLLVHLLSFVFLSRQTCLPCYLHGQWLVGFCFWKRTQSEKEVLRNTTKSFGLWFFSDPQAFAIFSLKLNAYIVNFLGKVIKKWYEVCRNFFFFFFLVVIVVKDRHDLPPFQLLKIMFHYCLT